MPVFLTGAIPLLSAIPFSLGLRAPEAEKSLVDRPHVTLDYGDFQGTSSGGVHSFYGIPFAEPPLGNRRLTNPIPPLGQYPNFDATRPPPACPQQSITGGGSIFNDAISLGADILDKLPFHAPGIGGQEDCLTLDVLVPQNTKPSDRLPVMFWIFPGDFTFGYSSLLRGNSLVEKSVQMGQPVIFVAPNYRLNAMRFSPSIILSDTQAFGFLGGREIGQAGVGNLGLKDQRLAMEWVQKYISEFGGDSSKVTIFGESAGAISVSYHLLINKGDHQGLFRAAICESGSAFPVETLSSGAGQAIYDKIVNYTGCASSPNTLDCLRAVDYDTLYAAMNRIPGLFSTGAFPSPFSPFIDGEFVTANIDQLLSEGKFAKVPLISGNEDDEGTLLILGQLSRLATEEDVRNYFQYLCPNASKDEVTKILQLYPQDITKGSPFNTGILNAITPVYKQYAALFGDLTFQAFRRLTLRTTQSVMPSYGYIDRAMKLTPILGTAHTFDLLAVFGIVPGRRSDDFQARWIAFTNTLDPNFPGLPLWEPYSNGARILEFQDTGSVTMIADDFREEAMDYYLNRLHAFRIRSA
ncbi:lipase [Melampsora americana]|nr:lipase [Melampsora americana]